MQSPLSHYAMLARRWAWLIVLGIVICGSATYILSKRMAPVYRASSILIITIQSSPSAFDNISASQLAAATYAQLLTSPEILRSVLAGHPGLTIQQLTSMVDAKAQPNTSLIEADFAQKLELVRLRYGSLAKFIEAQQSRPPREINECAISKRRFASATT